MNDSCLNRNFWLMTGIFILIVLLALVCLYFIIQRADFPGVVLSRLLVGFV